MQKIALSGAILKGKRIFFVSFPLFTYSFLSRVDVVIRKPVHCQGPLATASSFSRHVGGIVFGSPTQEKTNGSCFFSLPLCRSLREVWTALVCTRPLPVPTCYRGCLPLQIVLSASCFRQVAHRVSSVLPHAVLIGGRTFMTLPAL